MNQKEVDFIAEKRGEKLYVQVCYLLAPEQDKEREFSALLAINDNFPKYVVSMEYGWNELPVCFRNLCRSNPMYENKNPE